MRLTSAFWETYRGRLSLCVPRAAGMWSRRALQGTPNQTLRSKGLSEHRRRRPNLFPMPTRVLQDSLGRTVQKLSRYALGVAQGTGGGLQEGRLRGGFGTSPLRRAHLRPLGLGYGDRESLRIPLCILGKLPLKSGFNVVERIKSNHDAANSATNVLRVSSRLL